MALKNSRSSHAEEPRGQQDPWRAFSYVITGVLVYGLGGWGLDRWLGTTFLVGIGIVFGAVLGLYLTWRAFGTPPASGTNKNSNQ
ncbi:AtpZ/AtpI family protein [Nocardioides houyundeii]|uniref:AtpZ/AtpI family protein n=1 Tax=Nocardioides houyundeii TaxID=2045452 RepID=UPI000C77A89D|nr:AtpZ/AtpI family protein [Nocardioides houyundeii]